MQTFEQLKKQYQEDVVQKNPRAILVEYLQHELLDSLFKQRGSEHLSFMGGTAIRIVYSSLRFSEDLDFDNFELTFSDFETIIKKVIADMENKGFELEFRLIEKGAYHCYVKFPKILRISSLPVQPGEKILVRIDTVKKKKIFEPVEYILNGLGVYRRILVNPIDVVLTQKLITILERKRTKGRDFYDVSFLLGKTKLSYDYLKKQQGIEKEELKFMLEEKIKTLNLKELSTDVLPFLINPEDKDRILSFSDYIKQLKL